MNSALLDTHAVIWYLLASPRLSAVALNRIEKILAEGFPVFVTTVSVVELVYLVEKGRLPEAALEKLVRVLSDPASGILPVPLTMDVALALREIARDQIGDMPDRIIAATALAMNLPLISRDARIQKAGIEVIW